MTLRIKLNIIFICLIFSLSVLASWFHAKTLKENSQSAVSHSVMMVSAFSQAIQDYVVDEVSPAFESLTDELPAQSFPAYTTHQVFSGLDSEKHPLHFKTAFLEAEIERYQANFWQKSVIEELQLTPGATHLSGSLADSSGNIFYYAEPLKNGSNVYGASISYIYTDKMSFSQSSAQQFYFILVIVNLLLILIFNLVIQSLIIKPVQSFIQDSHLISQGKKEISELNVHSLKELQSISESFQRQQRSLNAAMNMLSS